ncbi:hypothetical protein [Micromonospora sp. NPDC093277]|uniref:hypothetical protein n=1 Tax=Micromonospora sp. NPDC093277 TaxID=3364291 RepID=UPI00381F22C0
MSRIDPDMLAVRDLPPGQPEPTDESVSRTWHVVTRRLATHRPPSRRWLVPVTAAAVVAALVVGGVTLLAPDRDRAASAPLTTPQVMDRLIDKAASIEPVQVPKGQLLFVRTVMTGNPDQPGRHTSEIWFDGETIMPLRTRTDGTDTSIDGPDKPGSMAEDNRNIVARGGSLYYPTPRFLADLPTDPAALQARLETETRDAFSRPKFGPFGPIMHLAAMFARSEPRLSPELRVGLYRLIAGLDGLAVAEVTVDGRRCWAVGQADEHGRSVDLLFDAETGHVIGERYVGWRDESAPPTPEPEYDPERDRQLVWTFAVVSDTSRTE